MGHFWTVSKRKVLSFRMTFLSTGCKLCQTNTIYLDIVNALFTGDQRADLKARYPLPGRAIERWQLSVGASVVKSPAYQVFF